MGVLMLAAFPSRADVFSPGELARPHQSLEGLANCTKCHEQGEKLSAGRCTSCHAEIGRELSNRHGFHGKLAPTQQAACQSCHHEHQGRTTALIEWGAKGEGGFDHSQTGFLLKGKHASTECKGCHELRMITDDSIRKLVADHPAQRTFLGLGSACVSCHFDEHRGQLGDNCASCHSEKAWKPAPGFDHAKTGYALLGAHKNVKCAGCHNTESEPAASKDAFPHPLSPTFEHFADVPHQSCADCHADPHKGQFAGRCESCHTVQSWNKVRDAVKERGFHDKTRFPLRGAHADVDCTTCHGPFPGQRAKFKGLPFAACTDCHADAHEGQIKQARGVSCERCHGLESFIPARFDLADHAKTHYPLEGAHQIVACNACHLAQATLLQKIPTKVRHELQKKRRPELFSPALFEILPRASRCEGCHRDPHGGQFSAKARAVPCAQCHQIGSFHELKFKHDQDTTFPLTGKHATVPCGACHTAPDGKGEQVARYRGTTRTCETCHEDVHAGQFALSANAPTDCARCHNAQSFTTTGFVHAPPFTDFELLGKHAALACVKCHPKIRAGEQAIQRFKPLPRTCAGCHSDPHRGSFQGLHP